MVVLNPIPFAELKEMEIPTPDWLIEGLLTEGTLCVFSAREKAGKGLIAIDAAVSIAMGNPFLGRSTKQGKVIYLAAEESLAEVKARLENRIPPDANPPVEVIHLDGSYDGRLDLTDHHHVRSLWNSVEYHRPSLLIIDVLREVHSAKEDSSDEMSPIMRELRGIAHTCDCTIIVNHHMSKAGQSRGSTSIQSGADVIWHLHGNTDASPQLNGTLTAEGRSVPRTKLSISFDGTSTWTATELATSSPHPTKTSRDAVLECIRSTNEHITKDEIVAATRLPEKTVGNAISLLKQSDPDLLDEVILPGKGSPKGYKIREADKVETA